MCLFWSSVLWHIMKLENCKPSLQHYSLKYGQIRQDPTGSVQSSLHFWLISLFWVGFRQVCVHAFFSLSLFLKWQNQWAVHSAPQTHRLSADLNNENNVQSSFRVSIICTGFDGKLEHTYQSKCHTYQRKTAHFTESLTAPLLLDSLRS